MTHHLNFYPGMNMDWTEMNSRTFYDKHNPVFHS